MSSSDRRNMAMYTVRGLGEAPDVASVAQALQVSIHDIDTAFGVIPLDPERGLYCVQADPEKVTPAFGESGAYEGPWSSPEIDATDA